jgi:hypothetical protein
MINTEHGARQRRADTGRLGREVFIPGNVFTPHMWRTLEADAYLLTVLLSVKPLIESAVKDHPEDWCPTLRVISARLEIQPYIARVRAKYAKRPDRYRRELLRLVRVHARSLPRGGSPKTDNFDIRADVPLRLVSELRKFLPHVKPMFAGETVDNYGPADFAKFWKAAAAGRPGAKPSERTKTIVEAANRLKASGQRLTLGEFCKKLFPSYREWDWLDRREADTEVWRILDRNGLTGILRHRSRTAR